MDDRWLRRRFLGGLLDVLLLLGPLLAGTAVVWWGSRATDGWELAPRAGVLVLGSLGSALVVDRLLRRLIPLATLMRLTMVFPDAAPSRLSVARLAGHPDRLRARLRSGQLDEAEAAATILALVAGLARHDPRTRGHSERTRVYTDMLGKQLGLPADDRDRLRWSALLHDIGKLGVDPHLLNKPGKPNADEWAALRAHPAHGADLAAPLMPWLGSWGLGIVEHHEHFDGNGYPHGLAGEQISRAARIISVADSFETMTAVRPYKKAMGHRQARVELARCAGTQFDPVVVRAFLEMSLPSVLRAMGPLAALFQLPFASSIQYAGVRVAEVTTATAVVAAPLSVLGGAAPVHASPPVVAFIGPVASAEALAASAAVTPVSVAVPRPARVYTVTATAQSGPGDEGRSTPRGPKAKTPRDTGKDKATKDQAKEREKAAKEREKAAREQEKDREKAAEERVKAAQEQAKTEAKQRKADEKQVRKAAQDHRKDAAKRSASRAQQDRKATKQAHERAAQQRKATAKQQKERKKAAKRRQRLLAEAAERQS